MKGNAKRLPMEAVLAIRRKGIIKDKRKQAGKYACRTSKGGIQNGSE